MAGLFSNGEGVCRLLDAGAGIGSLSAAFLERWRENGFGFRRVELDAFELDTELLSDLSQTLNECGRGRKFVGNIYAEDFIHAAVESVSGELFAKPTKSYTHAILNPPYKKINSNSAHRYALRRIGIETVNLYSAFVALAIAMVAPGGQVVAIIPRSFCNGPYYRPFREYIYAQGAIRRIHLFKSRNNAFKDDEVLQENVIILFERGACQGPMVISTSTDDSFADISLHTHPFNRIVFPDDPEKFIHVPTSPERNAIELLPAIRYSLADIGVKVSTGPVVDFRVKPYLREMPRPDTVPLLYPAHFFEEGIRWPIKGIKKPNALVRNAATEKWLYPTGFYCVVRRFSSKEEKRRIVASVVDPRVFEGISLLGLENHLNVFHDNKHGLPEALARGLTTFLNSTAVDEHFRRFNGHTQVNATDLKLIKYPSRDALIRIGEWAMLKSASLTQGQIDAELESLIA
ncbi:MAG: Eco57I restriction-modification methylase domain-containing protein [Candidatus Hydrogenedentes bacterium]|nr:Eco57I restriction-modification methylase domain-containing protein [Candidatus Hydrogenedentota bacterium]